MPDAREFDYEAALRRLIELRYSAREDDPRLSDEERRLERAIYNYVLGAPADAKRPETVGKKVKPAA